MFKYFFDFFKILIFLNFFEFFTKLFFDFVDTLVKNFFKSHKKFLLTYLFFRIIKTRSVQKNFQLIIITHDEDFVDILRHSDFLDQFYRVQKDEK